LKDKHAITKQYFTIPSRYSIKTLKEDNFAIKFLGYINKNILRGDLKANKFDIVIRGLNRKALNSMLRNSEQLKKHGIPNYFDNQRFRSVFSRKFAAKFVIKNDFESAVKIFLTCYSKSENEELKEEKTRILQHWQKLKEVSVNSRQLSDVLEEYKATKDWEKAYNKISATQKKMYFYAYQSYLWNECIKELLKRLIPDQLFPVKYSIGTLLFYKKMDSSKGIPLKFSTIGNNLKPTKLEKEIMDKIAETEGFKLHCLATSRIRNWNINKRNVILKPSDFSVSQPGPDFFNTANNSQRLKITVSFTLPAGSYATMIIKRLFN
jgi:tRNA pseudouridine13 synthase